MVLLYYGLMKEETVYDIDVHSLGNLMEKGFLRLLLTRTTLFMIELC